MVGRGRMEWEADAVYRFAAQVRREGRRNEAFHVSIFPPEQTEAGDSVCSLSCLYLGERPFSIYGIDPAQVLQLAHRFVEISLEHMNARLVDAEGRLVDLPPIES